MKPTEHEATVAVDAAARAAYAAYQNSLPEGVTSPAFDDLDPMQRNRFREVVLPLVWPALEALPDRSAVAWDEGWRAAYADHRDKAYADHRDNPYRT